MKIAISTDGIHVSAHFGRCPSFTILDIEEGSVTRKEVIDNPGHHPGFLPQFLKEKGVECIIAGGMGNKAVGLFNQHGIRQILGVTGTIDETVSHLLEGTLEGGESLCKPGAGKGYGIEKDECNHGDYQ